MHSFDNKPTKEFKKRVPQQTHSRDPYAGIRQMSSPMGNQAMLAMLRVQNQEGVGGKPFFEEIRAKFGQTRKPESQEQKPASQAAGGVSLPDYLREKFEKKSGLPMDDVRVHYNSDKPEQLGALAYTQGTEVFVGPGQESNLPHELTHVIQQKQGVVQSTRSIGAYNINDSPHLEQDAEAQYIGRYCNRDASRQDQGVIQCDWKDELATPIKNVSSFEKDISVEEDQSLATEFSNIEKCADDLQKKGPLLIYITVGTANTDANGTNPSHIPNMPKEVMEDKLNGQMFPNLLSDAAAKELQVITIHIDRFPASKMETVDNRTDFYINGVFPLSGSAGGRESRSVKVIKDFISKYSKGDNQVILVNAVENTTENEGEFRLFKGMGAVFPKGLQGIKNFTYATSYIEKQFAGQASAGQPVEFNIYKKAGRQYFQNLRVRLDKLEDIIYSNTY